MSITVGLDADDTLWHNETFFADVQQRFAALVGHYVDDDATALMAKLDVRERANLAHFGYGVKSFTLSMIETALELTDDRVTGRDISTIIDMGRQMMNHPVVLLEGVRETIDELFGRYRLVLITKGELFHQEAKVAASGLADFFSAVEVVSEKDVATYSGVLQRNKIERDSFVMFGNSVRSDVLPVLALGARAAHIPFEISWAHEHVEADGFPVLQSIRDVPGFLADLDAM
jgi:putative hydrolase of the HAD superfamily